MSEPDGLGIAPSPPPSAGGDLWPAPAPSSPGYQPTRTAYGAAGSPPDRVARPPARPVTSAAEAPPDCPRAQAREPLPGGKAGRLHLLCGGNPAGRRDRGDPPVGAHPRAAAGCAGPAQRSGRALRRGDAGRQTRKPASRPLPSPSASPACPLIAPAPAVERETAETGRFGIGGMTPGRRPSHRCG